jgi:hypothetical protein
MKSYRFNRRSFISATGAAVGLHTLLRNTEAMAQGTTTAVKRLLVTHHGVGTCRYAWTPTGTGTTYTTSRILKPLEDAGLRPDMIIVDGLNMDGIGGPGGGHEKGTVVMMTGTPTKGTRTGQTETDDAMAAGPSFDQLLLAIRPELARPFPILYGLCDDRIDFQEISTRCMSYLMDTRPQAAAVNQFAAGETPYENIPNRPTLKPYDLYTRVFGTMMPGGTTDPNAAALARARANKKSVLDFSLSELARLKTLAPASQGQLIDAHGAAIRQLETQIDAMGGIGMPGTTTGGCTAPMAPSTTLAGGVDDGKNHNNYGGAASNQYAPTADQTTHQAVGEAHMAIITAAFQCDLTRIGLFQWSPGTNHVGFSGMYPGQPTLIMQHHPTSHRITAQSQIVSTNPDAEFLVAVEIWYMQRLAELLTRLKTTKDILDPAGGSLLDNTVVPHVTEVADTTHVHRPMPLTIFGGKNLGFVGGQYLNFPNRAYNDYWLSILSAFGVALTDLQNVTVNGAKGATMLKAPYTVPLQGVRTG